MKLTIDTRLITNSGIGVYIQNILASPLLNDFDLTILHHAEDVAHFKNIRPDTELIAYNASLYSISELVSSPAKTLHSDIFWSPHYNVPLINLASRLKVVTIHDVYHLAYYNTLSLKQKVYVKIMMKRAVHSSNIVFTVSNFSKQEIIKFTGCKPDKIKVIYNGVDFDRYNTQSLAFGKQLLQQKYNITSPYILFVGNVKPHKNLKNALLGYKHFVEGCPNQFDDLKFVIAGKREGLITGDPDLKKVVEDPFFKANVLFTGWVDDEDLPALYQYASVFIFPSLYEGFGFPPLEAMAAACPVVSSNAACLPEIYQDAAIYFDPLDIGSISNALKAVLTNAEARVELIAKGLSHAKKFNWAESIQKKINIIRQSV